MDVILFRHGQKGLVPFDDPSLSPDGFRQADKIASLVLQKKLLQPSALWVSPKLRAGQTFQALSNELNLPNLVKPELDLRADFEQKNVFKNRVQAFIESFGHKDAVKKELTEVDRCIFVCTHYDWIEEAMPLIPADRDLTTFEYTHWAPAHYIHFKINNGLWQVLKQGDPR